MKDTIYIVVSVLAIVLYISSVQFKKKKNILIVQYFASVCYLLVYLLKGAWSGASVKLIEEIKDIVFIKIESKRKKIPITLLLLFLGLLIAVSIKFYTGPLSLIPLLINILLFSSTFFKNPKFIRYSLLITGPLWGVYNFYVGAYIILIGNVLEVFSGITSIIKYKKIDKRLDRKRKK